MPLANCFIARCNPSTTKTIAVFEILPVRTAMVRPKLLVDRRVRDIAQALHTKKQ